MAHLQPLAALASKALPPPPTANTTTPTHPKPSQRSRSSSTLPERAGAGPKAPPSPCPRCRGLGWLAYDVPVNHPLFGKVARCEVCGVGQQAGYLANLCGLSPEAQGWTFASTERTKANGQAYDTAELLAERPQRWLTLLSPRNFGVGKTRLLACIVNAARTAGDVAVYTTTADVLDYLRNAYAAGVQVGYDERMELLRTARVLCLDEFDRWNPTTWAQEKFFQLINHRYEHSSEQLTVFAANAEITTLPGYVASRMQDVRHYLYALSGQDVRRVRRE